MNKDKIASRYCFHQVRFTCDKTLCGYNITKIIQVLGPPKDTFIFYSKSHIMICMSQDEPLKVRKSVADMLIAVSRGT